MTDMLYEKQGSYLQGKEEGRNEEKCELAKGFRADGFPLEAIAKRTGLTPEEIKAL
ncbi:MAG: hypothetical protein MJZ26_13210 [Fibrobacter sp.]|nr:hypothetical protein [Fibrobacter sp.]